jgi:hypothetical protein
MAILMYGGPLDVIGMMLTSNLMKFVHFFGIYWGGGVGDKQMGLKKRTVVYKPLSVQQMVQNIKYTIYMLNH